jgi:hypothetical protein
VSSDPRDDWTYREIGGDYEMNGNEGNAKEIVPSSKQPGAASVETDLKSSGGISSQVSKSGGERKAESLDGTATAQPQPQPQWQWQLQSRGWVGKLRTIATWDLKWSCDMEMVVAFWDDKNEKHCTLNKGITTGKSGQQKGFSIHVWIG